MLVISNVSGDSCDGIVVIVTTVEVDNGGGGCDVTLLDVLRIVSHVMLMELVARHHLELQVIGSNHRMRFRDSLTIQIKLFVLIYVLLLYSFRTENPFFGAAQLHWLPVGHEISLSRLSVAADYPDSVPDSTNYVGKSGYHPLEGMRDHKRVRDAVLTAAETARTTVEANSNALLIFPGMVHCEPHEQVSWAEFQYMIDEYGDIFFEIHDDKNILRDRDASNPVNALIGMGFSQYEKRRAESPDDINLGGDSIDDPYFFDNYLEVENSEMSDYQVDWGMPDSSIMLHPLYFAKCLTKAIHVKHAKMMDNPSKGISIWGRLKPAFLEEEYYVRRLFNDDEVSDDYTSNLKAMSLWWDIFRWIGVSRTMARSVKELMFSWKSGARRRTHKAWNVAPFALMWVIWKEKNRRDGAELCSIEDYNISFPAEEVGLASSLIVCYGNCMVNSLSIFISPASTVLVCAVSCMAVDRSLERSLTLDLRSVFDIENGESFSSRYDKSCNLSSIYRLEIIRIELFSVYGAQLAVNLHDFEDAEPDSLVHSVPAILDWFMQQGVRCKYALKALCRKKGLHVERANLIGVDSLGIDVRVLSGTKVWTHRFPFKVRATTEIAAEKQIRQLLFPRSRRKKFGSAERAGDLDSL
ncbi:putative BTB/POZ domain-containing protein-like [Capsicum annuum]|nr:putative BTB/POZ domain-containing protein-like [Capsicum annuum]